ncbi:MAG: rod shape-determining protein RodA [Candidatus Eremiobacteraeota bacterium]|nr:rod shape-determining protein RodA [Candidatus Eremiobacteraeota bacterium]
MKRKLLPVLLCQDYPLYTCALGVSVLGWLALVSATRWSGAEAEPSRQGLFLFIGWSLALICGCLDYGWLRKLSIPAYLACLASLAAVMVPGIGQSAKGAQRWIALGPLGAVQPSEFAKLVVVIVLAALLAARSDEEGRPASSLKTLVLTFVAMGVPFLLIAAQPDLGTALVLVAVCFVMVFVAGASPVVLGALIASGVAALPHVLKEYQKDRLLIYRNPEHDPMGMGYSLVQSKTAIGSGGIFGKGLFAGHMTQHGFVPENWTDFIFTVLGEELGLIGCLGFLALFAMLLVCTIRAAHLAHDLFGALLCAGVATLLSFQLVVNVAMTIGLAPVVGLPLPLASYGGSALLTNLCAVGVVASVTATSRRRKSAEE